MMSNFQSGGNQPHRLFLSGFTLLHIALMTLPFGICWYAFYGDRIALPFSNRGNWVVIGLFVLLYMVFAHVYRGFSVPFVKTSELIYSQSLAAVMADIFLYLIILLLARHLPAVWPMFIVLAGQVGLSTVWSVAARQLYSRWNPPLRTILIWDRNEDARNLEGLRELKRRFRIVRSLHIDEYLRDPSGYMENIEAVFLCGIHSHERNQIIKACIRDNLPAYLIPRVGDVMMSGAKPLHLFHRPFLFLERYNPSPGYRMVKRAFDIFAAGIALILLSPVMGITALLIRRDGGPAFYRQVRLMKDGKRFEVLKFRSMRTDAEKDGVARLSTGENDERITPVGHVIRRFRIDELPQLINILKGEMSIVGPRPERPEIAEEYEQELPEFSLRLQAPAGLTGYAQVYGKYNTTPYDKLLMDLQYIATPSLLTDLQIMFATVKILFLPESTEGIAEGETTASGKH